jgi:hypothetical protein
MDCNGLDLHMALSVHVCEQAYRQSVFATLLPRHRRLLPNTTTTATKSASHRESCVAETVSTPHPHRGRNKDSNL